MARSTEGCVIQVAYPLPIPSFPSTYFCCTKVSRCPLAQRLLPFTQYKESILRRGGVVGALRNCCFESKVGHRMTEQTMMTRAD